VLRRNANFCLTNQGANSVSRLNQNGELIGIYAVETALAGIVFDGRSIWVTKSGSNSQLDCITGQLIDTSPVGNSPLGLCFDGTAVWVTNKTSNNLLRR
jgi:DNA-binding beta-propeller fold protein YncE